MSAPEEEDDAGDAGSKRLTVLLDPRTLLLIEGMSALLGYHRPAGVIHQSIVFYAQTPHIKELATARYPNMATFDAITAAAEEMRAKNRERAKNKGV